MEFVGPVVIWQDKFQHQFKPKSEAFLSMMVRLTNINLIHYAIPEILEYFCWNLLHSSFPSHKLF